MNAAEWQKIKEIFNATFDLSENERAIFLEKYDENLRCEVEILFKANQEANDFIVEPALIGIGLVKENQTDDIIGRQIDSYKILREVGHGGMGTVYLASRADDSFDKQVAIKLIKRGMDTNAVLKRFVMERQILANLENPFIASLLDGGSTEDGLPYLVMEYIEGKPITEFCNSHNLSTNERLKLFQKVCSAVSYAHQNLVVHRDIKPSNILVTKDGTPKLLDFGIAKLLNPEWSPDTTEATVTMMRLLTPEYASPEQLRGLPITTASDVYSLGVVLYELLSGERPYKLESRLPEEIAREILTQEPIKPSEVVSGRWSVISEKKSEIEEANSFYDRATIKNYKQQTTGDERKRNRKSKIENRKSLKGDLDNIVLKALRKEPTRRYSSVHEFSDDIRRHLEGLPVTARQDTFVYRTSKFIQRHRAGAMSMAVILIALLTATVITSWQARVARREREKAERRFNEVRSLANAILFKYHDAITDITGTTAVREQMVKDSLKYLDNLALESGNDISLQRELAAAYKKIGDIQGGPNLGSTDDIKGAIESYRKAVTIREKIIAANPTIVEDRYYLAGSYVDYGALLSTVESRTEMCQKAMAQYKQVVAAEPTNTRYRSGLARGYWSLARCTTDAGDYRSAIDSYRQAGKLYEELAMTEPDKDSHRRNVGLTYKYLGALLEVTNDRTGAMDVYRKAVAIDEARTSANPDNAQAKLDLSFSYGSVGSCLINMNDLGGALENYQRALNLRRAVSDADPKDIASQKAVARTYIRICSIQRQRADMNSSLDSCRQAIAIFEKIDSDSERKSDGSLAEAYSNLGATYTAMASRTGLSVSKQTENWRVAKMWFQRSLDIWRELQKREALTKPNEKEPEKIQTEISKCDAALAKLKG